MQTTSKKLRSLLITIAILILSATGIITVVDPGANPPSPQAETTAYVLDVGQGDSILLVSGEQAALIDASTSDMAETILTYLQDLGIQELYAVVATHPHADHIGSMAKVIDAFPVEHFYMGPETANTRVYSRMLDSLEARSIQPTLPKDGDVLRFASGATLTFLGPADDVSRKNVNNASLICLFEAEGQTMLLMGDAEHPSESSLLEHHPDLSCDILKVGHHGGATSSSKEFLRAVHPSVAVISCGADNDYGHPSPEVLENLANAEITDVRITAEVGTVVLPFTPESKENAA